jgi:myxalamid-type polyketide synthase MxaB
MNQATTLQEPDLLRRALKEIRGLKAKVNALETTRTEPVAVVGMACRFPGADSPAAFWDLLAGSGDAITEIPGDRWDVDTYFDPDPDAPGKMYTRWGGFINQIDKFSPAFFGIAPREAVSIDPQQRLLLEIAWRALENADLAPEKLVSRRVGVFVGVGATDYGELGVMQGTAAIDAYNGTGSSNSVVAGRLSYFLGVRGPSLAVDTACSSSLAALHLAVQSLRTGESDVCLVGGVNLMMSPDSLVTLCKARMLSPDGRCKTFDASANGYVRGEGCGVLVLKRKSDALAEGDNILGLVRGSAVNHNGRSGGLTVPSGLAQQELIQQALADAGLSPTDIDYVEAHGTGTAVGDPIEVEALGAVHANRPTPLLIGSVKSNVGHLEWAAGICGVMKVLLAMRHGQIPASLHVKNLNPHVDWARQPVRVVTELTPWPAGGGIAGVSSFGFGGTNAHVILEAPPALEAAPVTTGRDARALHILAVSAKSPEALTVLQASYQSLPDTTDIGDLCFSANTGRSHFEHRLAVTAASMVELKVGLVAARPSKVSSRPRIAMLFTGQGAQRSGMGQLLFDTQPVFRRALEVCDELLRPHLDLRLLSEVIYPADPLAPDQPIHETAYTQPALFAVEYALAELWASWGIVPDAVMGHSVGEYVAACRAGVFSLEDGLRLIAARGRLMQALPRNGAMLAVRAAEGFVAARIAAHRDKVSLAAVNGPRDVVVSGATEVIAMLEAELAAAGVTTRRLTVSHAFHSPLMEPMLAPFGDIVRATRLAPPQMTFISNLTGTQVTSEVTDAEYWVSHVRDTVRFQSGIERLADCNIFLEAGPQPVLLGLGRQCLEAADEAWLPSLSQRHSDWQQILESLGALYGRGAEIDWRRFHAPQGGKRIDVPPYPFEQQSFPLPKRHLDRGMRGARPLVEDVLRSPLVDQTVFSGSWSVAAVPFLADHRIFNEVVAPAASYVAHLLNGAAVLEMTPARIEDLYFVAPLVFAPDEAWTVQTVLAQDDGFRIVGFKPGATADEVTRLATGRLSFPANAAEALAGPALALADLQARCAGPIDTAWLSEGIEGIAFGPRFRWIDQIWSNAAPDGAAETLALLRRPAAVDDMGSYVLHPGLLDACFQAAEATLGDDGEPPLPFGIRSLVTAGSHGSTGTSEVWWTHARQTGPLTWDIRLYDERGTLIAAVDGFEARKAPRTGFRRTADWLYRIEWQAKPLEAVSAATVGDWLIVDSGGPAAVGLADRLRTLGHRIVTVPLAGVAGALTQQISWLGIVAFFDSLRVAVDAPGSGDAALGAETNPATTAQHTALRAVDLALAMSRAGASGRLWFATEGAAAFEAQDVATESGLAQSTLWGFVRSLEQEHPEWRPGIADLPERPAAADIVALADELAAATDETQVAWRGGLRHVARLIRHRETRLQRPEGPFRLKLQDYGSPERLILAATPSRPPGPGEVTVEVRAAALNFRDVLISLGMLREHYAGHLGIERAEDIRLGFDCAGTIVAVGEGVTQFKLGDAIMASAVGGSASHLTLPDTDVVLKPARLDFEASSAIPTVFLTANYGLLRLAGMKAGERVLIHAAAGGVGMAAVQLARMAGAEIFATASPEKWPSLRALGVRHLFHSRTLDFRDEILRVTAGQGVDIVLNSLGGEARLRSFDVLARGGRFVEIGKLGILSADAVRDRRPDAAYFTFDIDDEINRDPRLIHDVLGEVRDWFDAGRLEPLPSISFAIEDAILAYRYVQQTRHIGKVVLSLAPLDPPVRQDGAYLVTGGLGGLGLASARRLAAMGAGCLLLMGRRAPSVEAEATIAAIRAGGTAINIVLADAADEAAVAAALRASPLPLRGLIHAAGVLDDAVLENQSPERFARAMHPKADAAWMLHRLTRDIGLDFFVCYASMASAMGAAGQANYAAANAFLDGLAAYRRAQGLPALSIDWGPWASVGMAADLSVTGQGVEKIEVEDGLGVLADLLAAGVTAPPVIGVWRANWSAMRKHMPGGRPPAFLSALMRAAPPKTAPSSAADLLTRLRAAPEADRPAIAAAAVRAELIAVLELTPGHDISPTRPWSELGVDSLMMVELKNRLDIATGANVPSGRMAVDATVNGVAALIVELADRMPGDVAPAAMATQGTSDDAVADGDAELRRLIGLAQQLPQAFVTTEGQRGRQVLVDGRWRTDLASCNYLGLDLHPEVMAAIAPAIETWGTHPSWTRAVASPAIYRDLEEALAAFVGAPTTLVFPSISLLHMGVIPALLGSDGIIFRDFESHHSIHEGCLRARANGAEVVEFPHADIAMLERELARQPLGRTKLIATDGVFSMGASNPPLRDYVRLAKAYNATVYVDDAHGFGVIGERPDADLPYGHGGNGLVRHMGLDLAADRIIYVAGLSKAFSSYAAFVTCFDIDMRYRLEAAGPYVFSGPTCTASLASALAGLRVNAREGDDARRRIWALTSRFVAGVKAIGFEIDNAAGFPVVGVVVGTAEQLVDACQTLWAHDILITPAMYPAVPMHRSLIRFSITAANTEQEIDGALSALQSVWRKLRGARSADALAAGT